MHGFGTRHGRFVLATAFAVLAGMAGPALARADTVTGLAVTYS
jgi:hypothetical protein